MAQIPRKSSTGRKPADPSPANDLFAAAAAASADPDSDATSAEWLMDDSSPAPLAAKPISLPGGAQSLGSHLPAARIEAPPTALPIPPPREDDLPATLPIEAEPVRQALPTAPPSQIYDPFEIDEDLPPVPAAPARVAASEASISTTVPGASEDDSAGASPEKNLPPAMPRHPAGMIIPSCILLAVAALFAGVLYTNRPSGEPNVSRPDPRLPISGQVATLPSIESGWRTRQAGDLVGTVEITLPEPSRQPSALLPQVKFTTDPAATKSGFLRFIFLDPNQKIAGDVRVLKVNGGTIEPLSSGAIVSGPGTATVYGSLGFMDRPGYVAYATGSSTRWSVEISESADYNAKEEGWTKLETFDVRNASVE